MKDKVDFAVLRDAKLDRATIEKWLKQDIERVYVLVSEMLNDESIQKAITDVMWNRYQRLIKEGQIKEGLENVQ